MYKRFFIIFLCCLPFLYLTAPVMAAAGDLDPTYGSGGKTTTDFFGFDDEIFAAAVQPDGKTVVAGRIQVELNRTSSALARYRLDGSLDPAFGSNGKVLFSQISPTAVIIQPDGKIIVAGSTQTDFGLLRFRSNGSLDTTFGAGGLASLDFFGTNDVINDVALQPDGRIVAAGHTDAGLRVGIARFHSDGSPDITFGDHGKASPPRLGSGAEHASAIVIQPDLKIVAAGSVSAGPDFFGRQDFALNRFNPDGQLDQTFGIGGRIVTPVGSGSGTCDIRDVVTQSDGKILAAGFADSTVALIRYESDGDLDSTFGNGAKAISVIPGSTGSFSASALVLQVDAKIVVAGQGYVGTAVGRDVALLRYHADGNLDNTFGNQGVVISDFNGDDEAAALLLQPDGKLLVAGLNRRSGHYDDFLLARYLSTETNSPVLQTEANSNHALALDSVTLLRDPFPVNNELNFSADHRTRIVLFATNLTLVGNETVSSVIVQAQGSTGATYRLPVEYVGEVPGCEWLTQVVVKLPDELANAGTVLVNITHGTTSNHGSLFIK